MSALEESHHIYGSILCQRRPWLSQATFDTKYEYVCPQHLFAGALPIPGPVTKFRAIPRELEEDVNEFFDTWLLETEAIAEAEGNI